MDLKLFEASIHALVPYFIRCASIGQSTGDLEPEAVFPFLREAGIAGEEAMFRATGGVNTHKGAIYTLGILCAAVARLWHTGQTRPTEDAVLSLCAQIAGAAAEKDLANAAGETAGLRLYRQLGIRGIRGEMADGLPSVSQIALPAFRAALGNGCSPNDAGAVALLHLVANVSDTTLYHRGGAEGAAFAASAAKALLEQNPLPSPGELEALDDAFISRRLSPGGCADLLAATYFLYFVCDGKIPEWA
jgi:holo-ACP synthase/triphosphoribosyl-dephospho-CoA synthase